MKITKVIRKYVEFIMTKFKILYAQRCFHEQGVCVKYILKKKKNSDTLAIVFSACTRRGIKARYNYVKTLNGLKCSRLHILDDYADDNRGSYYLGENFSFSEEKATLALIDRIISETSPKKVIFCGSSKGGYAALNFGLQRENAKLIVGGPQYYLSSYLKGSGNIEAYRHIVGEETKEKEQHLEFYLRDRIKKNPFVATQKIYMHYSKNEHTYMEHIYDLLEELKNNNYSYEEDIQTYTNHSDISYYFPDYLRQVIKSIIES